MKELCVIEGDGISHEVIPAAVLVLQTVLPSVRVSWVKAGYEYFKESGKPIEDNGLEVARRCTAVLAGKASSPSYPVEGYYSPIVRLRRQLNTHANLRPATYLPVPTARLGLDVLVVRENTEDVYSSEEQQIDGGATVMKLVTRSATERIAHTAYKLAVASGRRRVTIVHKGNVMPQTDGLFRSVAYEVAQHYPSILTDDLLVDTAAYWMVREPTRFDIILTTNQYGDILSDMAAAWGGGLGLAPALNLGEGIAIAEPVHGTAPDIVGKGIANPTASILSVAMLARYHWQDIAAAERIENAVYNTLSEERYTADLRPNGALSTEEFTQEVLNRL
jgi:homoisocitrate dehydrogenase